MSVLTSRATNGSETKIVAITVDGSAKSTWTAVLVEPAAEPAVVAVEQVRAEADDDEESASGRSHERIHDPLARELASDDRQPAGDAETVFAGTAIAVMISVSLKSR